MSVRTVIKKHCQYPGYTGWPCFITNQKQSQQQKACGKWELQKLTVPLAENHGRAISVWKCIYRICAECHHEDLEKLTYKKEEATAATSIIGKRAVWKVFMKAETWGQSAAVRSLLWMKMIWRIPLPNRRHETVPDIHATIDIEAGAHAYNQLKKDAGSAVIINSTWWGS